MSIKLFATNAEKWAAFNDETKLDTEVLNRSQKVKTIKKKSQRSGK